MKDWKKVCALLLLVAIGCVFAYVTAVFAHCDTMSGPIIPEARAALEKGNITPILKWIKPENETELKTVFTQVVQVRVKNPEAKELADKYFLETLIRLHRAGEGAPYTGIKDTPPEKIVTLADEALATGSADEMIKTIQANAATAIREKYSKVLKASKTKDKSIESGREYVEAYVQYMHFVEGIDVAIMSTGSHHSEGTEGGTARNEPAEHKN